MSVQTNIDTKKCRCHKNTMAQKQYWHKQNVLIECLYKNKTNDSFSKCFSLKLHYWRERVRVLNVKGGMCCLLYRTHRSSVACCSRNTKTIAGIYCGRVQIMPSLWPPLPQENAKMKKKYTSMPNKFQRGSFGKFLYLLLIFLFQLYFWAAPRFQFPCFFSILASLLFKSLSLVFQRFQAILPPF